MIESNGYAEARMKKKGTKQIPDFSTHRPTATAPTPPDFKADASRVHPTRTPSPKPQPTSSKSGRRGQ